MVHISTYSFFRFSSSLHLQPLLMNNLHASCSSGPQSNYKKSSGEDYVGYLTAVVLILFLSSTPMMLHFENQPTLHGHRSMLSLVVFTSCLLVVMQKISLLL